MRRLLTSLCFYALFSGLLCSAASAADPPDWLGAETDSPTPSATSVLKMETPDLSIEGTNVRIETLGDDRLAYGNRTYVWRDVPARFKEWRITRTDGGIRAAIRVTARLATTVRFATAKDQQGIEIPDAWKPIEGAEGRFYYTDRGKTILTVFERQIEAGRSLRIPQGNWTGGILLLPPAE